MSGDPQVQAETEIVQAWQPTKIKGLLGELEVKTAWLAETIDELSHAIEQLADSFAAYRAKYPPPPDDAG